MGFFIHLIGCAIATLMILTNHYLKRLFQVLCKLKICYKIGEWLFKGRIPNFGLRPLFCIAQAVPIKNRVNVENFQLLQKREYNDKMVIDPKSLITNEGGILEVG